MHPVSSCHAPRERVSWNSAVCRRTASAAVTLHVSVWVEMKLPRRKSNQNNVTLHVSVWVEIQIAGVIVVIEFRSRSTWACELKWPAWRYSGLVSGVTLHVSVWVEICSRIYLYCSSDVTLHVSVWVEMAVPPRKQSKVVVTLHVSVWVEIDCYELTGCIIRVTLHVSVWVEIYPTFFLIPFVGSRSTWACELKYKIRFTDEIFKGHAPRERVSWNIL